MRIINTMFLVKVFFIHIIYIIISPVNTQSGPDPWNYDSRPPEPDHSGSNIPPDIQMSISSVKRKSQSENKLGIGEWFFKRTLAIVLRGGNTKKHDDGSVDVSLQMKFNPKQWDTLGEVLKSDSPLSEAMLRRSVGYIEESIYKPSIAEKIVLTWREYVQVYLTEYKLFITWTLGFLAVAGAAIWIWSHMSHKHAVIILLVLFYAYEVVISYKEAEQKELDKFLAAVNQCQWYFWTSTCEVPPPDPLVFMKHMNPMKIGIRMFTTALAEPFIVISGTVEIILHGITDGLWYPLNKLMYGILIVLINISLIFLLVMILFNWLLNIPFSLSFLGIGISVKNKNRQKEQNKREIQQPIIQNTDGISQATVDKILNLCSQALSNNAPNKKTNLALRPISNEATPKMRRSASTGRLPNNSSFGDTLALENTVKRRNVGLRDGSGDTR